ncbi:UNVERIFIED_CONTAM: serine proteinase inhibitor PI-2, putative [Hammondia hammondi]|eukprot:XP_008886867.1 serine proteinase inhibitor PI-2, putative [Hammondia hammondi]
MKSKCAVILVVACLLPLRCNGMAAERQTLCMCPKIFDPQCGVDGKTYANECERVCANVDPAHTGPCTKAEEDAGKAERVPVHESLEECISNCDWTFMPVCDETAQTWGNMCELECGGRKPAHPGTCTPAEVKVAAAPVGWTGPSLDQLTKTKTVTVTLASGKKRTCECPVVAAFVCGMDGKTYANECTRDCHGAGQYHPGPCKGYDYPTKQEKCPCDKSFTPMCGVDGKTYQNLCYLQCGGVRKLHDGTCWN